MGVSDHSHPSPVITRLEAIEQDLAERQNDYEKAAGARARLIRDWEKRLAIHGKTAKGTSADIRKATALASAIEQDDLYERLTAAESLFDAKRSVIKVLEVRATIGMSVLRAQGRGA